jgi:CRISPR-associated exonuclease Cas4
MVSSFKRDFMKSFEIPIHQLRQHLFCPRIPYYSLLLDLKPPSPIWVHEGENLHNRQKKKMARRALKRFDLLEGRIQYNVSCNSQKLGIYGIVDMIIEKDREIIPVEWKSHIGKPYPGEMIQLTAYSVCLEETFHSKVNFGFFSLGEKGKTFKVEIGEDARENLMRNVEELKSNMESMEKPFSSANSSKCVQCEFLVYCNDREI